MKPRFFPFFNVSLSALFATAGILKADVIYWDSAIDGSWGTLTNWSTIGTAGTPDPAAVPGSGDIATFTITGLTFPRTVSLDASRSVSGIATDNQSGLIILRGGGGTARTLTIGTEGINHLRGGITIGTSDADKVNILLAGSQTWNSSTNGNQAIQHQNDVAAAGAGTSELTLTGSNLGSFIRGNISNGAGTVAITKTGAGIWELQGTNSYTGATIVSEGILRLANASAASAGSTITISDNATLALKTANSGGTTGFNSAQITSFLTSQPLSFASTAARLGLDTSNGSYNFTGDLNGAFTLQKLGAGALTLSGTNSHTGATLITEGGIVFANDTAISTGSSINIGADTYLTVTEAVSQAKIDDLLSNATFGANATFGYDTTPGTRSLSSVTGTHGLAKSGANTLTLSGNTDNTYTGLTHVIAGALDLSKTSGATAVTGNLRISGGQVNLTQANQIADTAAVAVNGGTLNFQANNEIIASLTVAGGAAVNTGAGGGVINAGAITRTGSTSKITINSGSKLIASSVSLSGDKIGLAGSTGGNILIGGSNTTKVTELEITGNLTMTNQTIQVNSAPTGQSGTRITLGGNYTGAGANEISVSGATSALAEFALTAGAHTFTINSTGSGATLIEGNTVVGMNVGGAGDIVKAGAGVLSLTGNNTFTGTTTVNNGIIRVLHNNALGSTVGGTVTNGGAVRMEGNVTVTGESLRIIGVSAGNTFNAGLVNLSGDNIWNGGITMDVGSGSSGGQNARISMTDGTLDIKGNVVIDSGEISNATFGLVFTGNGGTGTISGNISGIGASQNLIKNGSSILTLTGTNTFTGHTRVDDGILNVQSIANNLGSPTGGNLTINLGEGTATGTFRYVGSGESTSRGFTLRSNSTGGGVIEQAGSGALVITGGISGNSATIDKTLTLQGSTSGTGELTGNLADSSGTGKTNLVKTGTGEWTLSGTAKTYEGTTTVTGGTLNVSTALSNSTAISIANGTFVVGANNVIKDDAAVTLGAGGILHVANFTDVAGVLAVTGQAQLHLAGGNNTLTFASSAAANWTSGTLTITGWTGLGSGNDQIIFQGAGLSVSQLATVAFVNPAGFADGIYSAKFDGTQLVPDALIPEPSSLLLFLAGSSCMFVRRRS
jgi:fibronectin-binding autotransporter adhesin